MKQARNKKTAYKRRGATIVELTVVLAILTIISTMVVSFSTLVSKQIKYNTIRSDFMSNAADCKFNLQTAFAEIDKNDTFVVDDDLSFNGQALVNLADYPQISSIAVEIDDNGTWLKCSVTNDEIGETLTFILTSHCGATFEGVSP